MTSILSRGTPFGFSSSYWKQADRKLLMNAGTPVFAAQLMTDFGMLPYYKQTMSKSNLENYDIFFT